MLRGRRALCAALALACGVVPPIVPARAAAPQLLDYHAYSSWRRIQDVRISRDGTRLAYAQVAAEADGELLVRGLSAPFDKLRVTGEEFRAPRGRGPEFSADGRFVVYRIAAPLAEVKAADKAGKPADERPKDGLGIAAVADLANARATTVERVRSYLLARDGATLAYLLEPSPSPAPSSTPAAAPATPGPSAAPRRPELVPPTAPSPSPHADAPATTAPKGPGKDAPTTLGVRRLGEAETARIPNVSAFAVSADGSRIAYVVQTKTDESIRVRDIAAGAERVIAHGNAHLVAPVLSADGTSLAYLSDPDAYGDAANKEKGARAPFRLWVADTASGTTTEALGPATPGVSAHTFASDARAPEFADDGNGSRCGRRTSPCRDPHPRRRASTSISGTGTTGSCRRSCAVKRSRRASAFTWRSTTWRRNASRSSERRRSARSHSPATRATRSA